MCMRSKKILFASGFAMQTLIFLCASNLERQIKVVNGQGKGGKISDALKFDGELKSFGASDFFLDNITGDMYGWKADSEEWVPKVNAGLHYRRAAQSHDSIGKYILKHPVYKPGPVIESPMSYLSKSDEEFCIVKKVYVQHWALQNVRSEFKIPFKSYWDVHDFNFINNNKTFSVLGETKYGPQIIYFATYCVATQFNICHKFPETVQILRNFIVQKIADLTSYSSNITNVEMDSIKQKSNAAIFELALDQHDGKIGNTNATKRLNIIKTRHNTSSDNFHHKANEEIPHSGYTLKKTENRVMVKNNTVRGGFVMKLQNIISENYGYLAGITTGSPSHRLSTTKADSIRKQNSFSKLLMSPKEIQTAFSPRLFTAMSKKETSFARRSEDFNSEQFDTTQTQIGKSDVRQILYPSINKEYLDTETWVPGNLSQTLKKKAKSPTSMTRPAIRLDLSQANKFYSRYAKDFKSTNGFNSASSATIRCSSVYQAEVEQMKKDEKEKDKKVIGPKYFKVETKALNSCFIPNTSGDGPIQTTTHKFRESDKQKWLAGDMLFRRKASAPC